MPPCLIALWGELLVGESPPAETGLQSLGTIAHTPASSARYIAFMFEPDETHRKLESSKTHATEAARELTEAATEAAKELRRTVEERGSQWRESATNYIEKSPLQALAFAGVAGILLALITGRRACQCQRRAMEKNPFD